MAHKAVGLLLLLTNILVIQSSEVGSIATIKRYNGEHLGPYIIKDFHSHAPDQPIAVAQPLTGDEEGSGDYSVLYGDTEDGDDTGSGLPTIQHLANNLRSKPEGDAETLPKPMSVPSLKEVSEFVFDGDSISTQTSSLPSPSTEQASKPSTPAPSTPEPPRPSTPEPPRPSTPEPPRPSTPEPPRPSTPEPPLSSSPALPPTASTGCHESCVSLLEAVTLQVVPEDITFVREGEGVRMTCSVSVTEKEQEPLLEQIQLNWLFQGEMPPTSECSLDGQRYLAACEGFASVFEEQQRNATHLRADILFTKLAVSNTGRYLCQAAAHCCGSLPQRQLQHIVTVWQAVYSTQLAVMITASVLLTVLVVVTVCYKRKLERSQSREYMKVFMVSSSDLPASSGKVLHLPLQQDDDFNDRDSFSSTDSAYP